MLHDRHRRLVQRGLPLLALGSVSFAAGAIAGAGHDSSERTAVAHFARAWTRQDFPAMYEELTDAAKARVSPAAFKRAYQEAYATATTLTVKAGGPGRPADTPAGRTIRVPVEERTRVFGTIRDQLSLPVNDGAIDWDETSVFPGLRPGEKLERETEAPERAPILARDGTPLAEGPAGNRSSPLGSAALDVTGKVGVTDPARALALREAGFPPETHAGLNGLERTFDERLAGKPGGHLYAVGGEGPASAGVRTLADARQVRPAPLRTTVDPELQQAAVSALAGRLGGVAVLDARDGSVLALAGAAFSVPQPPGSTFKIITASAALEAGVASPGTAYPVLRSAAVGGRDIENAHKAPCGGTLVQSFAESCNSVFAPLGLRIGSKRLIRTAERFGFNSAPRIVGPAASGETGAVVSSIPEQIPTQLELGVTAIGQGRLLATPLQLASAAQTIASGGLRYPTAISTQPGLAPRGHPIRVVSKRTARELRRMMVAVVAYGTGRAAAIAGAQVAGKTGTAELGNKPRQGQIKGDVEEQPTDAWFAGFAPAVRPRIALAVLLARANKEGGEVAAPAAREIFAAGLQR